MRRALTAVLLLLLPAVSGCVNALRVHEKTTSGTEKLRGIPFYVKKQICRQTTVYTVTWYEVTLGITMRVVSEASGKIEKTDLALPASSKRVDRGALAQIRALQQLILKANNCKTPERCLFSGPLARGAKSDEVRCLQRFLQEKGYLHDKPDGVFGARTEAAVRRFQRDYGLSQNGVFDRPSQDQYQTLIDNAKALCPAVVDAISQWAALPGPPAAPAPVEVANYAEPVVVVDYRRELYLNGKMPWFGETTVTAKLNADGTLSEASTTVAPKTAEALASLLPLKEYLTGEFVSAADTADDGSVGAFSMLVGPALAPAMPPGLILGRMLVSTLVELSVEEKGYKYTFSADRADPNGLCRQTNRNPIAFAAKGDYKRESLETKPAAGKPKGDKIEFSGNVSLPKKSEGK